MADGVVIMHNDVYANARLVSSVVRRNAGNGVTVRASFFEMFDCQLIDNGRAGFEYSPMYTADEAYQIRAGIEVCCCVLMLSELSSVWFPSPSAKLLVLL